jgi:hypothetical protein
MASVEGNLPATSLPIQKMSMATAMKNMITAMVITPSLTLFCSVNVAFLSS